MAGDFAELCATKAARQMVLGELAAAGRAGGLKVRWGAVRLPPDRRPTCVVVWCNCCFCLPAPLQGFEVPKNVYLEGVEALSVDNGLLTPTFKLRRPQARCRAACREGRPPPGCQLLCALLLKTVVAATRRSPCQLRVKYGAKMDVLYEEVRGKQGTVAALAGPAAAAR